MFTEEFFLLGGALFLVRRPAKTSSLFTEVNSSFKEACKNVLLISKSKFLFLLGGQQGGAREAEVPHPAPREPNQGRETEAGQGNRNKNDIPEETSPKELTTRDHVSCVPDIDSQERNQMEGEGGGLREAPASKKNTMIKK